MIFGAYDPETPAQKYRRKVERHQALLSHLRHARRADPETKLLVIDDRDLVDRNPIGQ